MLIKSYLADSSADALNQIRSEMGENAVVLRTRRIDDENGNKLVEITACLAHPSAGQSAAILDSDGVDVANQQAKIANNTTTKLSNEIDELACTSVDFASATNHSSELESLRQQLENVDLPSDCIERILADMNGSSDDRATVLKHATRLLQTELKSLMSRPIQLRAGDRVAIVGPAGSGKSSVMAKLAARLTTVERKKVQLLTLDDAKVGGRDELFSYAELLGIEVATPIRATSDNSSDSIILIDTPAIPMDLRKVQSLAGKICRLQPTHCIAVASVVMRSRDAVELAEAIKVLAPTHLVGTMLDLTPRHGSIVAMAQAINSQLVFTTDTSGGGGSLLVPDATEMAKNMLRSMTENTHPTETKEKPASADI